MGCQFSPYLDKAKFDAFRATFDDFELDNVLLEMGKLEPIAEWFHSPKGLLGYRRTVHLKATEKSPALVTIAYDGNGKTAMLEVKSDLTTEAITRMKALGVDYRTRRYDSCLDWDEPGLFDTLANGIISWAKENGKQDSINCIGNWAIGKARTLELGKRGQDGAFIRLYEKGFEQQRGTLDVKSPHWVRLEVEYMVPKASGRSERIKYMQPADVFRVGWVSELLQALLFNTDVKLPVGHKKHDTDADRALQHMLKQYGDNNLVPYLVRIGIPDNILEQVKNDIIAARAV